MNHMSMVNGETAFGEFVMMSSATSQKQMDMKPESGPGGGIGETVKISHNTLLPLSQKTASLISEERSRKRVEKPLEKTETTWRSLFRNVPDVIMILDREGTILFNNHRAFGTIFEETVGKTVYDCLPPGQHNKTEKAIQKVFESGEVISFETEVIRPDGGLIWYSTRLGPIRDGEKIVNVAHISTDITETKRKEEKLRTFCTHMARAEWLASLGTLSATIAHKLSQPLTVIRLSLDDALDKLDATSSAPQAVTTGIKEALIQVSNLTSILGQFQKLAREHPRKNIHKVDVKAVVEKIIKLLSENAQRKNIRLHLKEMDRLPRITMNERDLEQLCFALIENAIQAGDGQNARQLTISSAVKGRFIELCFSDDCGGIAQENMKKIFKPFFTTKPPHQGTGLGLHIVQEVVSRLGGKIYVESKFGEGSTFFVTLPITKDCMS